MTCCTWVVWIIILIIGSRPIYNSYYGKPDRIIHYSFVLCEGHEAEVSECNKLVHSLKEGRSIYDEANVAGVVCESATPTKAPPPCIPVSNITEHNTECTNGDIQLIEDIKIIEYCIDGIWSNICHISHNESTVACRQLGYTYTCEEG